MKNYKRILAILLTGVMVAGSTVTAFAEDGEGATPDPNPSSGTIESEGEIEAIVDTDVFGGVFPTTETGDGLKFFMDPQGLLHVASPEVYKGGDEETGAGAVYFTANETDNTKSADLTFKNKSSYDVTAKLSVTVEATGIDLVESGALAAATKPSLALLISDGDESTDDTAITDKKAVVQKELKAIAYKFDSKEEPTAGYIPGKSGKYYYAYIIDDSKLVDSDVPAGAQVTYNISGACSVGGDWSKVKDNKATAKVVWDVKKVRPAVDYSTATDISLVKGTGAVYESYEKLGFAASDVDSVVVDIDGEISDADFAASTQTAIKIAIDSSWNSASKVKVYIILNDGSIKAYTFK